MRTGRCPRNQRCLPLASMMRCARQQPGWRPEDSLVAFLDDLYIITSPAGARAALDEVAGTVAAHCGIASNLGKTRAIAAEAIPAPPGIAELGDEVWRGDKPEAQRGVVVLGTPLGHPAFVQAWAEDRMRLERQLLDHLPHLPDLQCAWLLLLMCASPRTNHAIRTLPPSESVAYARITTRPSGPRCAIAWAGLAKKMQAMRMASPHSRLLWGA